MTEIQKTFALALFDNGAIKFSGGDNPGFRLKLHEAKPDAPLSPIYLNLRTPDNPKKGDLTPELVSQAGEALHQLVSDSGVAFDHVIGIPHAGTPLAQALFEHLSRTVAPSLLTMQKEQVGDKRRIGEIDGGDWAPGDYAILVDDLITEADSKIEAAIQAREQALMVRHFFVLVDREQGGVEKLKELDYTLHAVFKLSELLTLYVEENRITKEKANEVREYLKAS